MTAPPAPGPEYMTVQEVATLLRVSRHTVLRRIAGHSFPGSFQTGGELPGRWRIPTAAVHAFIARRNTP